MMVQDPFYFDFSKQPDNEIWYTTIDNKPIKNSYNQQESSFFIGYWGKQPDLQFVNHTYENGLGKIIYSKSIIRLGEKALNTNNVKIISFPKQFKQIHAYCLNYRSSNMYQLQFQPIGIFNVINNTINISVNSVIFYHTYVKNNVTFNGSYKPSVIIVR